MSENNVLYTMSEQQRVLVKFILLNAIVIYIIYLINAIQYLSQAFNEDCAPNILASHYFYVHARVSLGLLRLLHECRRSRL